MVDLFSEHTPLPSHSSSIELKNASHAQLAAHYAPVLCFDHNEPFVPVSAGYTVYYEDSRSSSFPRHIILKSKCDASPVHAVIEYAIWFDWDIGHLYELEHIWVYITKSGSIVRVEGSRHGKYHDLAEDGPLNWVGDRVIVYAEPGKHAFAGNPTRFASYQRMIEMCCGPLAGISGVHITRRYKGIITRKNSSNQNRVKNYLKGLAFSPSMQFTRVYESLDRQLVPWKALGAWIPRRVDAWLDHLILAETQLASDLYSKSHLNEAASLFHVGVT